MKLIKDEKSNMIILDDETGKKLNINVDIDGNLDFHMNLKTNKKLSDKESTYFKISDDNDFDSKSIYFATAKLFQDLLDTLTNFQDFYKDRFKETPVYNESRQCFKFHNDSGKINNLDYIRFFRRNGEYYFFFNQSNKEFNLSKLNTRYKDFSNCFNKFYSNLDKECVSKDLKDNRIPKFTKKSKYGDK